MGCAHGGHVQNNDEVEAGPTWSKSQKRAMNVLATMEGGFPRRLPAEFFTDRAFTLHVVSYEGMLLETCWHLWGNDRGIVKAAVSSDGRALQFASTDMRNDVEIVEAAISSNGLALQFASRELRNDLDIVEQALRQNPLAFRFVEDRLSEDSVFAHRLVTRNGLLLERMGKRLRSDHKVVLAAVEQNGLAIAYASKSLQSTREIAYAAVCNDCRAMQFVGEVILSDRSFVLDAVKSHGSALVWVPKCFSNDRDIVLAALSSEETETEHLPALSPSMWSDRDVVLAIVQLNGLNLEFVPDSFQHDFGIVAAAVQQDPTAIKHALPSMRDQPAIMQIAIQKKAKSITCSEKLVQDEEFLLRAINVNCKIAKYIAPSLVANTEFMIDVVAAMPVSLCYYPELRNSADFLTEAMKRNPDVFEFAGSSIRNDTHMQALAAASRKPVGKLVLPIHKATMEADAMSERSSSTFAGSSTQTSASTTNGHPRSPLRVNFDCD